MYHLYILRCKDGTLYTGITTDLARRLAEHKAGKGGAYTRAHGASRFVYTEAIGSRSDASKREVAVKSWSRDKKARFISERATIQPLLAVVSTMAKGNNSQRKETKKPKKNKKK